MKNISNNIGFTLIEIIVVITILSIVTIASIMGYNSFNQGVDLDQAEESVLQIIDEKKLNIANGRFNCAELKFNLDQSYYTSVEHSLRYCDGKLPLLEGLNLDESNILTMYFPNQNKAKVMEEGEDILVRSSNSQIVFKNAVLDDLSKYILIKKNDQNGIIEDFIVEGEDDNFKMVLEGSKQYTFDIYECIYNKYNLDDCLDEDCDKEMCNEKIKEDTYSKLNFYYYSDKNYDLERVDHVIASGVEGIDLNNQTKTGAVLDLKLSYPDAKVKVYLDDQYMKKGNIELNKEGTVLDPVKIKIKN